MSFASRMQAAKPSKEQSEHPVVVHFLRHYRAPNLYTLRVCRGCGYHIGYFVGDNDHLYFDGGCDCSYASGHNIQPRGWDAVIHFFDARPELKDLLLALNVDRVLNENPIRKD